MKGMNFYSIIRNSTVCYFWFEGEPVIGTFFVDNSGAFTGIHFRSSICPKFIKEDNAASNETEQTGMTGFYAEVTDVKMRWQEDNSLELLVRFDKTEIFCRVYVLTVGGCIISDKPGILP